MGVDNDCKKPVAVLKFRRVSRSVNYRKKSKILGDLMRSQESTFYAKDRSKVLMALS